MKLEPNETELQGSWKLIDNSMIADEICKRIEHLISSYLIKIGEDETGWNILYQDPKDERYWELSYPQSEMHGGSAPLLRNLSLKKVQRKLK